MMGMPGVFVAAWLWAWSAGAAPAQAADMLDVRGAVESVAGDQYLVDAPPFVQHAGSTAAGTGGSGGPWWSRVGSVGVRSIEAAEGWAYPREVTLKGRGFGSRGKRDRVLVGAMAADIVSWSPRRIVFRVPAGVPAAWHDVTLMVRGLELQAGQFGVRPHVTALAIDEFAEGTRVTLQGAYFGEDSTRGYVVWGEWEGARAAVVESWTSTEIVVRVPDDIPAGTNPVWVWHDGAPSNHHRVELDSAIRQVRPEAAYPGDEITVYGRFDASEEDIRLDGEPVQVLQWTGNRIRLVVPDDARTGRRTLELRARSGKAVSTPVRVMVRSVEEKDPRWEQPAFEQAW